MGQIQSSGGACDDQQSTGLGILSGAISMLGGGAFVNPVDSSQLTQAQQQLQQTEQMWTQQLDQWKNQITDDRFQQIQSWVSVLNQTTTNGITTLGFQVQTNRVLLVALIWVVFFMFLFDLSLPMP
jgi:predicted PurR-regulated permease PerM